MPTSGQILQTHVDWEWTLRFTWVIMIAWVSRYYSSSFKWPGPSVVGFVLSIIHLLLCWGNVMDLGLINIFIENTFTTLSHTFLKGGLNHWGSTSPTFNRLFSACNAWNVAYYRVWHWECFPLHYSSGQCATKQKLCILTTVSLVFSRRPNKWKTFYFISCFLCVFWKEMS